MSWAGLVFGARALLAGRLLGRGSSIGCFRRLSGLEYTAGDWTEYCRDEHSQFAFPVFG